MQKNIMIETKRIRMYPASKEQMKATIAKETDEELKSAYSEMLEYSLQHTESWEWYAMWNIELLDGTHIGDFNFKGLDKNGVTEIGYAILEKHRGNGYATEAVKAATAWALQKNNVTAVEAETDANNVISQKVLARCGFIATGAVGEEGPRFVFARR